MSIRSLLFLCLAPLALTLTACKSEGDAQRRGPRATRSVPDGRTRIPGRPDRVDRAPEDLEIRGEWQTRSCTPVIARSNDDDAIRSMRTELTFSDDQLELVTHLYSTGWRRGRAPRAELRCREQDRVAVGRTTLRLEEMNRDMIRGVYVLGFLSPYGRRFVLSGRQESVISFGVADGSSVRWQCEGDSVCAALALGLSVDVAADDEPSEADLTCNSGEGVSLVACAYGMKVIAPSEELLVRLFPDGDQVGNQMLMGFRAASATTSPMSLGALPVMPTMLTRGRVVTDGEGRVRPTSGLMDEPGDDDASDESDDAVTDENDADESVDEPEEAAEGADDDFEQADDQDSDQADNAEDSSSDEEGESDSDTDTDDSDADENADGEEDGDDGINDSSEDDDAADDSDVGSSEDDDVSPRLTPPFAANETAADRPLLEAIKKGILFQNDLCRKGRRGCR